MTYVDLDYLVRRRDQLLGDTERLLLEARQAGRETLTRAEADRYAKARDELRAIARELRTDEGGGEPERLRQIAANPTLARLRAAGGSDTPTPPSTPSSRSTTMQTATLVRDDHLVYNRSRRNSWVRDFCSAQTNLGEDVDGARRRLAQHADEVRTDPAFMEYRDISRVDGQGGYAVPPAWLMDQYVELARPGRAFANLVQSLPLPGGTDSINIPKLLTGTAVGVQTADNQAVTDVDLTDTFINAPVRTISGQEGVSIQLLDQSPIAFDDVIFKDLTAAYAGEVDQQVLYGTGSGGQVLGVDTTPGITSIAVSEVTVQGVYTAIANAIQTIHTTRFRPPEVCVMHPRRWGWLLSQFDTIGRPLFIPNTQAPMNAGGILTAVESQQVVGTVQGLPIVTDPNLTTTAGSESPVGTEDQIIVARVSDLCLWESGLRARVLPEVKSQNLTVVLQVYGYLAFSAGRYPQSVAIISGLTPPSW